MAAFGELVLVSAASPLGSDRPNDRRRQSDDGDLKQIIIYSILYFPLGARTSYPCRYHGSI